MLIREPVERGLDEKTMNIIKQTLTGTKSKIKFMGELADPFEIKTGVRQSDGYQGMGKKVRLERLKVRKLERQIK